jgi:hypothetical protein
MHTRAITPSIGVMIGRQMRLFHAFVTAAPAVLDAPSTVTLYLTTLSDVSGLAADPSALDTNRTSTPARLVLVDSTELDWQRARYREGHYVFVTADPVLVGLNNLQQWLWQRLRTLSIGDDRFESN